MLCIHRDLSNTKFCVFCIHLAENHKVCLELWQFNYLTLKNNRALYEMRFIIISENQFCLFKVFCILCFMI